MHDAPCADRQSDCQTIYSLSWHLDKHLTTEMLGPSGLFFNSLNPYDCTLLGLLTIEMFITNLFGIRANLCFYFSNVNSSQCQRMLTLILNLLACIDPDRSPGESIPTQRRLPVSHGTERIRISFLTN
jgi:hypothetical protein